MLKNIVLTASAALAVFALAGCTSAPPATDRAAADTDSGLTLAEVLDAGELVVATEGTYRPFSYHEGGSGALTGYDVEIITAVAERLGVDVTFEETQWDAIFAGLDAGRFDVIANQVSLNPERQRDYDFSVPYTISPGVLIVAEGTDDITSFNDLEGRTSAQSLTSNWYAIAEDAGASVESV